MELTIRTQESEPVFGRSRIAFSVSYEGSVPSRKDVRDALAKQLAVEPERLVIRAVLSGFGKRTAEGLAYAYADRSRLEEVELAHYEKRGVPKEE